MQHFEILHATFLLHFCKNVILPKYSYNGALSKFFVKNFPSISILENFYKISKISHKFS